MIRGGANHTGGDQRGTAMPDTMGWPADRRITVRDLQAATDRRERWSMLTSYDALTAGHLPRFVQRYTSMREELLDAASRYATDVAAGRYPDQLHSYA